MAPDHIQVKIIKLILASSSEYRRSVLERLAIPFTNLAPGVDESSLPDESPENQVMRLAEAKAVKIAETEKDAVIIGSDQLAVLNGKVLGKPGNHAAAFNQLREMSGECVRFITALCVLNSAKGSKQQEIVVSDVFFRELSDGQIERYLQAERPYRCAGSFRSESLGITLIERMDCPDPTALIGLPLIKLSEMLNKESYKLP